MRILVACRKFDNVVGGVERMSTTLMNELLSRGHEIFLFTWDENENAKSFYFLSDQIKWTKLSMGNPMSKAGLLLKLKRAIKIRKILKDIHPDVVLGFQEGSFISLKLYSLGLNIPMVCAVRNSPFHKQGVPITPPVWFRNLILHLAAAITVQFDRYAKAFPHSLSHKMRTIPNHVAPANVFAVPDENVIPKIILSTGRLSREKNHAALVSAFSLIAKKYPDWELVIVGRGIEEENLKIMIKEYPKAVQSRISFPGVSTDIPSWLAKAHIFCFPSWWEGFPNSLAEAMAHGLPSIGFAECDGVCDLIEDGVTGLLADGLKEPECLAEKLEILMSDSVLRRKMGDAACLYISQFNYEMILSMWERVLEEAAGNK